MKERVVRKYKVVKTKILSSDEEKELNELDEDITHIMLKTGTITNGIIHDSLWSPEIHRVVRKVTILRAILTQYKTGLSQQKNPKATSQCKSHYRNGMEKYG